MTNSNDREITLAPWVTRELPEGVRHKNFLDHVEDIFAILWATDKTFVAIASSTDRDDAIEGGRRDDEGETARMIRDYAKANGYADVAKASLAEIRHAAGVVARRRGESRSQIAIRKAQYLAIAKEPVIQDVDAPVGFNASL